MTPLARIRLLPASPWRTPWQADTLTGALCSVAARVHGVDFLRQRLIEPMLAGRPPFVLSDAFPSRLLPVPVTVRLARPPEGTDRKKAKRGRWVNQEDFLRLRAGATNGQIPWEHLRSDQDVFCEETTRHNTLSRLSNASLEEGGLFARPDTHLRSNRNGPTELTLYFRAADNAAADMLLDLLHELSLVGFGADVATGRGQFTLSDVPQPAPALEQPPQDANGVVVLSTFQPAAGDPIDGYWEAFPKFAKLGPDLGVSDVRKNTLIMFRPGACFRTDPARPFMGAALEMKQILPDSVAEQLRSRDVKVIHPAFGLAIPIRLPQMEEAG